MGEVSISFPDVKNGKNLVIDILSAEEDTLLSKVRTADQVFGQTEG